MSAIKNQRTIEDTVFASDRPVVEPPNGIERLVVWLSRMAARISNISEGHAPASAAAAARAYARARVTVGDDFELVEIRPGDDPNLSRTDVSNVLCLDLDLFSISSCYDWISSARRSARGALPRFVVVGPSRPLSNAELSQIATYLDPIAVFFSRPVGCTNFTQVLEELGSQIRRVSDPKRLVNYDRPQMALSATDAGTVSSRRI